MKQYAEMKEQIKSYIDSNLLQEANALLQELITLQNMDVQFYNEYLEQYIQRMAKNSKEVIAVISLKKDLTMLRWDDIAYGTEESVNFKIKDIFMPAITCYADMIVVIHNHPGNYDLKFSQDDVKAFNQIEDAADILGIKVFDFYVISQNGVIAYYDKFNTKETKDIIGMGPQQEEPVPNNIVPFKSKYASQAYSKMQPDA
jgi:DNA repair protein RadC